MNLKKRGLALLMCLCMVITLLPVAAFADDAAVVYGQYEDGVWQQDPSADGTVTSDNITISKTAEPVSGEADTYRINLSVTTTTTTTQVPPGSAATVLVMDVSGSMDFCAECGADEEHYKGCKYKDDVKSSQSRLTSAKAAANSFLDSYSGTASESGNGRYVAIVKFASNSSIVCEWTDVSTSSGLAAAKNVINGLKANGGTNLDAGLQSAAALLGYDAVKGVTSKNVIALTDGQPTFYGNGIEAHGNYGCPDTNNATAASAKAVRALADVYTVCFGVANELCWEKGSVHEWGFFGPSETHSSNGPTVGAFLRDSIATAASADKTYAYNANNTAELNKAFEAITKEITSGLTTGLEVTDSAGQYIDMSAPSQYVSVEEGYEWTLSDPVVSTEGNKTIYTYSVSYIVKLDTSAEGFVDGQYYPTNGETYLTYTDENGDENKLYFEIPGVKGTAPRYTVTYNNGANGDLAGQDTDGNVKTGNIRIHSATPAAPAVTADEGYYFTGWDKEIAATVTADVTYTAQYAAKSEITVQANSGSDKYDGTEKTVSGLVTDTFTVDGATYTVEGLTASAAGTDAGTYDSIVTGTPVVRDADGSDVTERFTVKTENGTLTISKRTVTLTSASDKKEYDGKALTNDNVTVGGDGFAANEGASYDVTGSQLLPGTSKNDFTYSLNDGTKASNYSISKVFGDLKVTDRTKPFEITVQAKSATATYDGTEKSVSGFLTTEFTIDGVAYTVEGLSASAKGTDAGTYPSAVTGTAIVRDANGTDVTAQFTVYKVDGSLVINPNGAETVVTITGNHDSKAYTGSEQKVEGYTVSISSKLYTEDDFTFSGTAAAARTTVGKTMMELKSEQFENTNKNFSNVVFKIADGWIEITPVETELKVAANSNSWEYDGQEHADGGYTVTFGEEKYELKAGESATLSTGDTVTAVITKTVKHVSDTAEGNNEIVRLAVDNESSYKTINKVNGTLTVTPAPLTITAGSSSQPYVDGVVMCNEYTNTPLVDGDRIESVKITGQQDGPGKSDNVPSDAVIKNAADEDVTGDYDITYVNGVLEGVPKLEKDVHFNYIMGYKDGTIRPNNNITRAEVATIFFRLLTDESREYYLKETNDFNDIPDTYWACPAISTLTNAGILKGFEDGSFRPSEPVTRAQMAAIIARFANLSEGTVSFSDIEGHWAQKSIELAAGNGWINGYADGTFRPNEKITRAATMAMINRVLDRHVENVEDLLPDMNVWSDNMDPGYTFYFDIQEATNFHECQRIDNSPNEKWTVKLEDIDWTVYEF
ncbi:MAG: S-layer homology domain-containing protein [Oscillospiraceae bacterium]